MRDEFLNLMAGVGICLYCLLVICLSWGLYNEAFCTMIYASGAIGATAIYALLYVERVPQKRMSESDNLTLDNLSEVDLPREQTIEPDISSEKTCAVCGSGSWTVMHCPKCGTCLCSECGTELSSAKFADDDLPREEFYTEAPLHLDGKEVLIQLRDGPPQMVYYYDYYTGELLATGKVRRAER